MPKEGEAEWKCREREITVQIAKEIERYYAIYYSEIEIDYLTEIMMSYLIPVDFQKISKTNIDKVAGITCMSIVNELFRYIKSNFYFINTENECFVVRFALHIKKLLCRLQSGHIINDPSKDDLKMSYPFIFECAVSIAWKLTQITGHKLTEDNIAYIAVHMGNNFVEQKSKTPKLCCCLLITHYYDYGEQVIEKISKQFENDIIILDILRVEKQINDFKNLDLIISTVSLPESFKTEWVRINPFVLEPDITRISRKIKSVMLAKKKQALYNALLTISNSNLFCKNLKRKNKITQNDVILFMKDILERDGYVDKDFDDAIVEREKYSSTAFGQIAVPHPIQMTAHKTGLFVMINDKPILWGKHEVNVILLFAINKNDWEVFSDVLDTLVALMLEIENLNKVMQCNTYEEFVDVVVSLVE
jgi:lichenan operon transcriptional antiterminator